MSINIDKWEGCYHVRAFDWIDGKNIYLNIAYYKPNANLEKPPAQEKSFLLPKSEEPKLRTHLNSIVYGLMAP